MTHDGNDQPEQIGPYRIQEQLGEGGMAVVYLAEQYEPVKRSVALKILKPGMDSKQIVARFESERQALAVLEHPNIAKIFDGGIAENGRPYFAMEYVDGLPITEFCDAHCLDTDTRLRLFIDICRTVQHAHLKGLIHRDLKPSNIIVGFVDNEAQPKVIDFGVAKATEESIAEATLQTRVGQFIGTPHYMSPEQTGSTGGDIDTRADIYSLGVVLYELLVGTLPIDLTTVRDVALAGVIQEKVPPKPSNRFTSLGATRDEVATARDTNPQELIRRLKGDLDWIVMKAIEKDRSRRYETANALAMECERYLNHEPVLARPPHPGYVLNRFVRRNRVIVAAASVAVLAILAGAIAASLGYLRATEAEQVARQEAETAKQVSDFLVGLFEVSDPSEARGNSVTAREVLDAAVNDIDNELQGQPNVEARLKQTMAKVYMNLGLYRDASELARSALEIRRGHAGKPAELAASLDVLGELQRELGDPGVALALHKEAVEVWEKSGEPPNSEWVASLQRVGYAHYTASRLKAAEQAFLAGREMALALSPPDSGQIAEANGNLGVIYSVLKNDELAIRFKSEAAAAFEEINGRVHPLTATAKQNLAWSMKSAGQFEEASAVYGEALAIYKALYGEEHPLIANTMNNMAMAELPLGNYAEAESLLDRSLAMYREIMGESHWQIATAMTNLGRVKVLTGDLDTAESLQREALTMKRGVLEPDSPRIAIGEEALAGTLNQIGRYAEAEVLVRQAIENFTAAYGPDHGRTAYSTIILGRSLTGQGQLAAAEDLILANVEIVHEQFGERSIEAVESLRSLVSLYEAKGELDQAAIYQKRLASVGQSAARGTD